MKKIRGIYINDDGSESEETSGIAIDRHTVPNLSEVLATLPEPEDDETVKDLMYRVYGLFPVIPQDAAIDFFDNQMSFDYGRIEEWHGGAESEDLILEAVGYHSRMH